MRIQTIHRNPMGDVLNECSAQGFRITAENGDVYDINTEGGMVTIQTRGCIVNLEFIPELLRMLDIKKPAAAMPVRVEGLHRIVDRMAADRRYERGQAVEDLRDALAQQPTAVDGAMVERAREAYYDAAEVKDGVFTDPVAMHAALTAAIAQQPEARAERAKICYQCAARVTWLADDSRCSRCTRLTPDEIIGGS